jgi:hypothetical protein
MERILPKKLFQDLTDFIRLSGSTIAAPGDQRIDRVVFDVEREFEFRPISKALQPSTAISSDQVLLSIAQIDARDHIYTVNDARFPGILAIPT